VRMRRQVGRRRERMWRQMMKNLISLIHRGRVLRGLWGRRDGGRRGMRAGGVWGRLWYRQRRIIVR